MILEVSAVAFHTLAQKQGIEVFSLSLREINQALQLDSNMDGAENDHYLRNLNMDGAKDDHYQRHSNSCSPEKGYSSIFRPDPSKCGADNNRDRNLFLMD